MANPKITRVKYFTKEKKDLINPKNIELYQKYLRSCIIKDKSVKDTTYAIYENYFTQFLVYLAEEWDNIELYSDTYMDEAVDIMEGFIAFCQDTLCNNKKVINTKLSAVSSFYLWSMKRGLIDRHPFDKKLDRMKGANDEKIINSYFLNDEQVQEIRRGLLDETRFDIQDRIIWEIMLYSANRVGAISKLTLSSFDSENSIFNDIREKRGYLVDIVVSDICKELILEWMNIRNEEWDKCEVDSLFIVKYKGNYEPMTKGSIQRRINKMGTVIGLEDFHAHCIRKTTLNQIYEETGDLTLAAELASHKETSTTFKHYIKPKSKAEIRDKINELRNKNK